MKGLFLNNFYSAIGNIKLFLFLVLAMGIAVLITGNTTLIEVFVYVCVVAFPINGIVTMRKDSISKWNKYEVTMPVRRRDIISCKFLSYVFWIGVGAMIGAGFTFGAYLLFGSFNTGVNDYCSLFALGVGISVMVGALFYPLAYIVGVEKSETILVISVIGSVGLAIWIIWLLNRLTALDFYMRIWLFVLIYCLLYIGSYVVTRWVYQKKEV